MFNNIDTQTLDQMHSTLSRELAKLMTDIRTVENEKTAKGVQQQITTINSICTSILRLKSLRKDK
jgi:hypothetical protein